MALKGTRKAEHEERGASGTRLYGARIIKGKEPIRNVEKKRDAVGGRNVKRGLIRSSEPVLACTGMPTQSNPAPKGYAVVKGTWDEVGQDCGECARAARINQRRREGIDI